MKHTPEEIINALRIIQDECAAYNEDCLNCSFYTNNSNGCKFIKDGEDPANWRLNKTNAWKAFVK